MTNNPFKPLGQSPGVQGPGNIPQHQGWSGVKETLKALGPWTTSQLASLRQRFLGLGGAPRPRERSISETVNLSIGKTTLPFTQITEEKRAWAIKVKPTGKLRAIPASELLSQPLGSRPSRETCPECGCRVLRFSTIDGNSKFTLQHCPWCGAELDKNQGDRVVDKTHPTASASGNQRMPLTSTVIGKKLVHLVPVDNTTGDTSEPSPPADPERDRQEHKGWLARLLGRLLRQGGDRE